MTSWPHRSGGWPRLTAAEKRRILLPTRLLLSSSHGEEMKVVLGTLDSGHHGQFKADGNSEFFKTQRPFVVGASNISPASAFASSRSWAIPIRVTWCTYRILNLFCNHYHIQPDIHL